MKYRYLSFLFFITTFLLANHVVAETIVQKWKNHPCYKCTGSSESNCTRDTLSKCKKLKCSENEDYLELMDEALNVIVDKHEEELQQEIKRISKKLKELNSEKADLLKKKGNKSSIGVVDDDILKYSQKLNELVEKLDTIDDIKIVAKANLETFVDTCSMKLVEE